MKLHLFDIKQLTYTSVNIYFSPFNENIVIFAKLVFNMNSINLAIFASGSGSNAQNIINYFTDINSFNTPVVFCNNPNAYVLKRNFGTQVDFIIFSKEDFENGNFVQDALKKYQIDFIILAGFLLKVPQSIVNLYNGRIINIHPALLPDFGGKGMYGMNVHKAVISAGKQFSGITIHVIDEQYDKGQIIFQAKCPISSKDTPETLASNIHELEQAHFPRVIEEYINKYVNQKSSPL